MKPRFLFIQTYYPDFLEGLYAANPSLGSLEFEAQHERVFSRGFSNSDAFSHYLRELGCEAFEVIVNADLMQRQWAREHDLGLAGNIHDRRRRIVEAQISHYRPDVVYVFEWCPLGDAFLADIRTKVRLLVGQVSSTLPDNRTFAAYDLMFSSWPPIVDHFRSEGRSAEFVRLGFDHRILDHLGDLPENIDVSFVGGFAPAHGDRVKWLEHILTRFDVAIYGYGLENVPDGSPIHRAHCGPIWGLDMYRVLKQSKVTINLHARIDVRGIASSGYAANMRLFESTGVGTCLITERRANLLDVFEPEREVLTYASYDESIERIRHALDDEASRRTVAEAGQRRTLSEHTHAHRMEELLAFVQKRLRLQNSAPRATGVC